MTATVSIVEVGARDGLQNERETVIATRDKLALIAGMIEAGIRRIEVASFVNPSRVPQMADAEAVIAGLEDRRDVSYIGLCLNKRGVLRAIETRGGGRRGVDEAGCAAMATDGFGLKNQGQTVQDSLRELAEMIRLARSEGLYAQVTISPAYGCPYEGPVPAQRVVDIARALVDAGAQELSLGDTIGVAVPNQVRDLFGRLFEVVPPEVRLRAHFHNTRNMGIANVWAAVDAGVRVVDSSLGGLGGCPFAPKATGNVATEDVLYLLERSGVATGVDLQRAIAVNHWFAGVLGRPLPSMVGKAGGFPAAAG